MAWSWLKIIPWGTVLSNAPGVYKNIKSLLISSPSEMDREREKEDISPAGLQKRINELEEKQRRIIETLSVLIERENQINRSLKLIASFCLVSIVLMIFLFSFCLFDFKSF